jgi:hypothetical protein
MKKKKTTDFNDELPADSAVLEHTDILIHNVHDPERCGKEFCTVHNRSNHHMRSFPQYWRSDIGVMERTCSHGVGHPDPDEFAIAKDIYLAIHGCDGCCQAPTQLVVRRDLRNLGK